MSDAQLVPTNWASSQPHLALLEKFLSAREVKDWFLELWAPAFGTNPQRVIEGLVAHGALELAPTVADLKVMLSSRGLKVSGKKAELIQRLLEADPKGMEVSYAHRMILRCTPAASEAVSRWEAEQARAFETASDSVIAALRNRHFKEAIRTADAYRKNKFKPPVHPAQEAMTIHPAPRSIEEREKELATVFTMRPKILNELQPEQWEGLYLNYAVWELLGRTAPEKCMPGFTVSNSSSKPFLRYSEEDEDDDREDEDPEVPEKCVPRSVGIRAMNSTTATRMLSFYVKHQSDLKRMRELGIKKAKIIGTGGCEACLALKDKTFLLDELPELPYEKCTCGLGCRCMTRAALPWTKE
ncbi:MAG: SAP domain-containing protein [Acidobacteriaceae bacterium]